MLDRQLKALFAALLGLMAAIYAVQDLVNLPQSYAAFASVLGQADHPAFPKSLFPSLGSPLVEIAAWVTILCEAGTGLLLLLGAWRLWSARKDTGAFEAAKGTAKLGAAAAIVTWFGLFGVIGGAAFQMGQTQLGSGSLNDAFKFSVWGFFLLLYLNQRD
jgi:predicted small integral membrane protein